jgi:hypothetical protein
MNKKTSILLLLVGAVLATLSACKANPSVIPTSTNEPSVTTTRAAKPGVISTTTHTPEIHPTFTHYKIPTETATVTPRPFKMFSDQCIRSFDDFVWPIHTFRTDPVDFAPLPPWQLEATVPTQLGDYELNPYIPIDYIEMIRSVGGQPEIWIRGSLNEGFSTRAYIYQKDLVYLTYKPETQSWNVVSAQIDKTDLMVRKLFVTRDGSVWGETDMFELNPGLENVPNLSRYNEATQRFEVPPGLAEIPGSRSIEPVAYNWPYILLYDQDIFWIFTLDGGIYSYNPVIGHSPRKETSMPESYVVDAAQSWDGSIFLLKNPHPGPGYITDGLLLQFFPKTGKIVPLAAPHERWPLIWGHSLLVDHTGNLWVGSEGYRDPDGNWHVIHPNLEAYFSQLGVDPFVDPNVIFESSDGILWFTKFTDYEISVNGTAWYDPKTGEGCKFTNLSGTIIEDANQTLWFVADGKLYRYKLNQQ